MILSRILFIIIFQMLYGFAMAMQPYDEDIESCKRRAIVSGYSLEALRGNECGVMTLCFKKIPKSSYEHTALVFEVFNPMNPAELLLRMVHYGGDGADCCGTVNNPIVDVEGERQVLPKLHRGQKISLEGRRTDVRSSYTKYASWVLPTASLIAAIRMGEEDSTTLNTAREEKRSADVGAKNCVNYAAKIMRQVGLQNVDFFWWKANTPDHLKQLVNDYIMPRPEKNWGPR